MRLMMSYSSLIAADLQNYLFLPLIISLLIVLVLPHCITCDIKGDHLSKKRTVKDNFESLVGFLFCLMFKDARVHRRPGVLVALAAISLRSSKMWSLQQSLQFCFHHICSQEKCELVQIILGKPENNINHLIAFKNKAVLSQKKFCQVKVGPEVIYKNLLEILQGDFTEWTARRCTKIFKFFSRFCFF